MIDVDLPSLTTINSGGNNFCHPRSVTLESNYNYYVKLFKDIPNNCLKIFQILKVPELITLHSIIFDYYPFRVWLLNIISFIDVAPALADLVK